MESIIKYGLLPRKKVIEQKINSISNDELKNKFKNVEESEFIQGEYKYRSLKIILE